MSRCDCWSWEDLDVKHRLLTGHHPNCPNGPQVLDCAYDLIRELARSLEAMAVSANHPEPWEAYRKAKALEGVFLEPTSVMVRLVYAGRSKPLLGNLPEPDVE